jgi:hypothetical protein
LPASAILPGAEHNTLSIPEGRAELFKSLLERRYNNVPGRSIKPHFFAGKLPRAKAVGIAKNRTWLISTAKAVCSKINRSSSASLSVLRSRD